MQQHNKLLSDGLVPSIMVHHQLVPYYQGCNESLKFWVESSHLVSFYGSSRVESCTNFNGNESLYTARVTGNVLVCDSSLTQLQHWYDSRTTPHEDNSPPDTNKAQPLPTRTTIPRTIPHQDNSPLGPLPRNKTTHQDQNLYGGELSSWKVVRIRTGINPGDWRAPHQGNMLIDRSGGGGGGNITF